MIDTYFIQIADLLGLDLETVRASSGRVFRDVAKREDAERRREQNYERQRAQAERSGNAGGRASGSRDAGRGVWASGATPSVRILARSKRYAGPYYADLFGIAEDDLLYSVRRLNCIDGEPVSIEMTLIPCLLFPGIEDVDISVFSLFETYDMLGRKPDKSIEKLDIEALGARDASLLNLEPGDLALVLECMTYDSSGQAIEHAKSFNRGDAGGYTYNY